MEDAMSELQIDKDKQDNTNEFEKKVIPANLVCVRLKGRNTFKGKLNHGSFLPNLLE